MKFAITTFTLLFSLLSSSAFSEDETKKISIRKEQRETMALGHEKMATCLRSDKSIEACHDEMRQSCKNMDDNSCSIMGMRKMGKKGRMGNGMMPPDDKK